VSQEFAVEFDDAMLRFKTMIVGHGNRGGEEVSTRYVLIPTYKLSWSNQDHLLNTTTMTKSALVGSGRNGNHADRVSQPNSADVLPMAIETLHKVWASSATFEIWLDFP